MTKEMIGSYQARAERALDQRLPAADLHPGALHQAMRYAVLGGGKRIRPVLVYLSGAAVGARPDTLDGPACAVEFIHAYSLIHDDLPAMDDDDYRRGRLTNHKVFGDGMAILAGDGLLTLAFETLLSQPEVAPEILARVAREVAQAAGPAGMVGGQAIDLESEGQLPSPDVMKLMHRLKTGALFRASLRAGAMLGGGSEEDLRSLTDYAEHFGLAFQITDDILDVTGTEEALGKPIGSDEKNQKATYVSVYSLTEARRMAQAAVSDAVAALERFGDRAWVLRSLAEYLLTRDS